MPKVIPFGDNILVRRRKIGEKIGAAKIIVAADETKERPTDLADVMETPDLTFADKYILDNAEAVVSSLTEKAKSGDSDAVNSLLSLNEFIKRKSIRVGDAVMIGKYVGVDFHDSDDEDMTLVRAGDIIGLVVADE